MAQIVTSGVFPVHNNDFEVQLSASGRAEGEWVKVAELEEIKVTIDNNTETWSSFANEGWDSALVTGKSAKIEIKGKRCIGDAGNDLIASKLLESGQNAYIAARITSPDGKKITWDKMACGVTDAGNGGKATDVGALEATLTGHGKPKLENATSTSATTAGETE